MEEPYNLKGMVGMACQGKKKCKLLVCTTPYLVAPSLAGSEASSGVATSEILSEKISRLRRSEEEYSAAFEQFTDSVCELGLECEDVLSRLQPALGQDLLNRRQEEAGGREG